MKIAIDLDNVLVDHVPLYKKIFRTLGYGDNWCLPQSWGFDNWTEDLKKYIIHVFKRCPPEEMVGLPPFPDVQRYLRNLKSQGHWLEIVTCRVKHSANLRYILNLFPMVDWVEIVGLGQDKIGYLNDNKFDLWVDDYPQHAEDFKGHVVLISNGNTLYNHFLRNDFRVEKGLTSIRELLAIEGTN